MPAFRSGSVASLCCMPTFCHRPTCSPTVALTPSGLELKVRKAPSLESSIRAAFLKWENENKSAGALTLSSGVSKPPPNDDDIQQNGGAESGNRPWSEIRMLTSLSPAAIVATIGGIEVPWCFSTVALIDCHMSVSSMWGGQKRPFRHFLRVQR